MGSVQPYHIGMIFAPAYVWSAVFDVRDRDTTYAFFAEKIGLQTSSTTTETRA